MGGYTTINNAILKQHILTAAEKQPHNMTLLPCRIGDTLLRRMKSKDPIQTIEF